MCTKRSYLSVNALLHSPTLYYDLTIEIYNTTQFNGTQNELFKEQVDQVLGNDFRDGLRRHQGQGGAGGRNRGAGARSSQQQRQGQGGTAESSGDIMGIPGRQRRGEERGDGRGQERREGGGEVVVDVLVG